MDDNTKLIQDIVAKVISEIGTKEIEEEACCGNGSCGGSCGGCPGASMCHHSHNHKD